MANVCFLTPLLLTLHLHDFIFLNTFESSAVFSIVSIPKSFRLGAYLERNAIITAAHIL